MNDPNATFPPGAGGVWDSYTSAGKSLQTFASEIQRVSKESLESTTKLMEQLRGAKTMEEVVSIQSAFMHQSFTNYADTTRRLSELMMAMPMEFARQSQTAFMQSADAVTKATKEAGEKVAKAAETYDPSHHG